MDILLIGGGISHFARDRSDGTPVEWLAEAGRAALADAGSDPSSVDMTVIGYESEILARQLSMGQAVQDALGLCPKPSLRVEAGGATGGAALYAAVAQLRAGLARSVLVLGSDAVGRLVPSATVRKVYALSGDVDFEMAAGGFFTVYYALMIKEHMRLYGTTSRQLALVSVKNHKNACSNPFAAMPMRIGIDDVLGSPVVVEPYRRLDCSILADGAAAVLLGTTDWARDHAPAARHKPRVVVTGIGCATERVRLGDRPRPYPGVAHFRAKREAAKQAYAMAHVTEPRRDLDVAEVADPYTGAELQACEALGFCEPGEAGPLLERGVFELGGRLPVNTSGGQLGQGGPPGAIGIAQAVEVLRQLRGEAPCERQVPNARRGLTDIHGGTASYNVVCVYERQD